MKTTEAAALTRWPWWTKAREHLRTLHRTPEWLADRIVADVRVLENWLERPPDERFATAPAGEASLVMRIAAFFGWPPWYLYDARHPYPLPESISVELTLVPIRLRQPPRVPRVRVRRSSLSASSMRDWDR